MTGILVAFVGNSYGSKPVNTVAPVVSGTATVGQTLSTTNGTWTAAPAITSFTYQWQRDSVNISGATSSTYVLVAADIGTQVRCVVTAINPVGSTSANSNATATVQGQAPVNTVAPVVSGTTTVGQTLSTTTGTWTGNPTPTFTYQWQRNSVNISGATSSSYTLVNADYNTNIRCVVTGTNAAGTASANSNSVGPIAGLAPVNTVAPVVSGTAASGQTLSTTNGTWTGAPTPTFAYQWQRNSVNISGATSATYLVVDADIGSTLRCVVTATNALGSASANSNFTSVVTVAFGAAYQGGYFAGQISTTGNGVATHNLVVAPKSSGESILLWKTSATPTSGTDSVIDGPTNSSNMNNASHPAAQFCEGLTIGGYSDWYMPARNELEICYYNLKPFNSVNDITSGANTNAVPSRPNNYTGSIPDVTTAVDFQYPNSQAFTPFGTGPLYWASTSIGVIASFQGFSNGGQGYTSPDTTPFSVRAVRRVAV
jgi:hypothetical protein